MKKTPLVTRDEKKHGPAKPQRNFGLIPESEGEPEVDETREALLQERWSDAARAASAAARRARGTRGGSVAYNRGIIAARKAYQKRAGVAANFEPAIKRGAGFANRLDAKKGGTHTGGAIERLALKKAEQTIARQKGRFSAKMGGFGGKEFVGGSPTKLRKSDKKRLRRYMGQYI